MGGCDYVAPSVIHCAAQGTSTVRVNTHQFSVTTGTVETAVVEMLNHTQCGCQCVVQAHHCDNVTEIYDPHQCKCVCKNLQHTCNATLKVIISYHNLESMTQQVYHSVCEASMRQLNLVLFIQGTFNIS
jgi:hypothetical protein